MTHRENRRHPGRVNAGPYDFKSDCHEAHRNLPSTTTRLPCGHPVAYSRKQDDSRSASLTRKSSKPLDSACCGCGSRARPDPCIFGWALRIVGASHLPQGSYFLTRTGVFGHDLGGHFDAVAHRIGHGGEAGDHRRPGRVSHRGGIAERGGTAPRHFHPSGDAML